MASKSKPLLKRLGLLAEVDGKLHKTKERITTSNKAVTSKALRSHQKEMMHLAKRSLENDPIDTRCMISSTLVLDPEKIPLAKRMIEDFMSSLCQTLEAGEAKQVYGLQTTFFPLQTK